MKPQILLAFAIAFGSLPGAEAQAGEPRQELDCARVHEIELWRAWPSKTPTGFLDLEGEPLWLGSRLDAAPVVAGIAIRETRMIVTSGPMLSPPTQDPEARGQVREEIEFRIELRLTPNGQRVILEEARRVETGLWDSPRIAFRVRGETIASGSPLMVRSSAVVAAPLPRRIDSFEAATRWVRALLECK